MPNYQKLSQATMTIAEDRYTYFRINSLLDEGFASVESLPFSLKILLESMLRQFDERQIASKDIQALASWSPNSANQPDVPFKPARVIMQDFTGVPAVVDLAAMRSALARLGGNPSRINPQIPVDLVIDHSVQVDFYAIPEALEKNAEKEFLRNRERYEFLRWGQEAFDQFRVVPPATGIVHQVNLEYLAEVVVQRREGQTPLLFPDSLVGTDSHTTMINGIGVLGWGVGGIEAEAAMLGQPLVLVAPEVIGFNLRGRLPEGTTATDLVLTVTQILREEGVVGKFVEFFGPGLSAISLPNRATIANMCPEYGATVGFFPVDQETLRYLQLSGRSPELIDRVERYCKEQGIFRTDETPDPNYSKVLTLDMSRVESSLAGPRRPQDRIKFGRMKETFQKALASNPQEGGFGVAERDRAKTTSLEMNGGQLEFGHGSVVIAAITSCTNTSNPSVMIGAGLLAKKAVEKGLRVKPYVKTSLAPGSRVVTEYLSRANLIQPLAELGFQIVGYGCTTCIGNSGPLATQVVDAIRESDLVVSAVLSGNRNFEGRINPHIRANYLASPPLVVAFAIAGTAEIDMVNEPLGNGGDGQPVYLRDIWPSETEIQSVVRKTVSPDIFQARYGEVFTGNSTWNAIPVTEGNLFEWDPTSTYIQEPPFFMDLTPEIAPLQDITNARVLALLGDTVTTDHISPAGAIPVESPAGQWLIRRDVQPMEFNSYGSRRGNDQVMTRGTFGNIRLRNLLLPRVEGGETLFLPDKTQMSIYKAAMKYKEEGTPLLLIAGKEYGTGSSRDWAAKGTLLLGVKAVLAQSFERIHRSNLVGMGVLPLQFTPGDSAQSLGLSGLETYDILGIAETLRPGGQVTVRASRPNGQVTEFQVLVRIDTPIELEYYRNGGILHAVLRGMLHER
jgi:aconitate hydratase